MHNFYNFFLQCAAFCFTEAVNGVSSVQIYFCEYVIFTFSCKKVNETQIDALITQF